MTILYYTRLKFSRKCFFQKNVAKFSSRSPGNSEITCKALRKDEAGGAKVCSPYADRTPYADITTYADITQI